MPLPRQMDLGTGNLVIGREFSIELLADPNDRMTFSAVDRYRKSIEKMTGFSIPLKSSVASSHRSSASLSIAVHNPSAMRIGADESYSLSITSAGVRLEAETSLGALRGMVTLRQLTQKDKREISLPVLTIHDSPQYPWRGLMIDVARHFMPVEVIQRNLDAMELAKLNVLHLHLSDNEGFRIESKVFPKLQLDGSNGKYYTQEQMRGLIQYAQSRGIVIVPEFDMPSHTKSWLAGYPELSSSTGTFKPGVLVYDGVTPKSTMMEVGMAMQTAAVPAFDPTQESTYQFIDQFIGEMSALFPAPYIHIGADENNGAVWRANPTIVAYMKSHQIADAAALQAHFVSRVESIVRQHGKQMVAWEEAYSPDGPGNTIYQTWSPMARTDLTRLPMAKNDKVLVSKGFYLDLLMPAHTHYSNDALPKDAASHPSLLGGEAAMWAELADASNLESRIWPRAGAIAERLWTSPDELNAADLYPRLFQFSALLNDVGVHQLTDYDAQVDRIAGSNSKEPVNSLLSILTPVKGYTRVLASSFTPAAERDAAPPLHRVSDFVLVDSETKYQFRDVVAAYLKTHDAASEQALRATLVKWSSNADVLRPYYAHSDDLREVSAHADRLADLSRAALQVLDKQHRNETISPGQLEECDALLKAATKVEGQTEIAVLPEIEALLHGRLPQEPDTYPLF